mgnify:CR=1 FL=1
MIVLFFVFDVFPSFVEERKVAEFEAAFALDREVHVADMVGPG